MHIFEESKKQLCLIPTIALVLSSIIIILVYAKAYSGLGIQRLPVGWDTPNYVNSIKLAKAGYFLQVIQKYDYVNFLYYFIGAIIPFPPFVIETYFPIFLAICVIISIGLFTKILTNDMILTSASMIFASTWIALYRLTSDLHANLLSIPLMFIAMCLFIQNEGLGDGGKKFDNKELTTGDSARELLLIRGLIIRIRLSSIKKFFIPSIIIISSFTHFENTSFFILTLLIAVIFLKRESLKSLFYYMIVPLFPSIVFYILHNFNPVYFPTGLGIEHEAVSYSVLFSYLGDFWPLVFAGLILSFLLLHNKRDGAVQGYPRSFIIFALVWLGLSLIIFRLDHYFPTFFSFSYRAATFLPIPLLSAIPFFLFKLPKFQKVFGPVAKYLIAFSIIGVFTILNLINAVMGYALPSYNISYFSDSEYQSLISLENIHFQMKPIFVFYTNDLGVSSGAMSEYPDRWISVVYGDHYKYLGFVDNLLDAKATAFKDSSSKFYSLSYIQEMKRDKVWDPDQIIHHPIIILRDSYTAELPSMGQRFRQIGNGLYEFENADATAIYSMSAMRAADFTNWGIVYRTIGNYNYSMLESYVSADNREIFNFTLSLAPHTCHLINMKYMDGSVGLGFDVVYGNKTLSTVYYQNPGKLKEANITYCPTDWPAVISIIPNSTPGTPAQTYFVSIYDNVEVTKIS